MKTTLCSVSAALISVVAVFASQAQEPPKTEEECIAALTGTTDWVAKQAACRVLRQVGTARSVPALAALLDDSRLSHWARYALEPMPIPEAGAALRDALGRTSGSNLTGVVISLGARQDALAVEKLAELLGADDANTARAAAGALGRIATTEAITALSGQLGSASGDLAIAVAEGLLAAAEHQVEAGKADAAVALYQKLLAAPPARHIELGAFRGLAYAQPDKAPEQLIGALKGEDQMLRDLAAQTIAETSGADDTRRYADSLGELPATAQPVLVRALAGRGDRAARAVVVEAATSEDAALRVAALNALSSLGTIEDVPLLADALDADLPEAVAAARAALVSLQGDGVDAALVQRVATANATEQAGLLGALTNRMAPQTLRMAVHCFERGEGPARIEALNVFALMGGPDQMPLALGAMKDPSEAAAGERALLAMCERHGAAAMPTVMGTMRAADAAMKKPLLGALLRIATPEALDAVAAATKDADAEVAAEAVRTLSSWPKAEAAPHLLALAQSEELQRNVLGIRGYVRLVQGEASPQAKADMLRRVTELTRRPEEARMVMSAWGTVPTAEALDVLVAHLEDEAIRDEVSLAIVDVAPKLGRGQAESVRAALERVIAVCKNEDIVRSARRALDQVRGN